MNTSWIWPVLNSMNSSWTFHECGLCMKPWIIHAYVSSWILHELSFHEFFMNKSHFLFTSFTWSLHEVTSWIFLEYFMNTSWRMTKHFAGAPLTGSAAIYYLSSAYLYTIINYSGAFDGSICQCQHIFIRKYILEYT
jgi:hypothetical protein